MVRKKISERKTNKEISRGTNNKIITMTASDKLSLFRILCKYLFSEVAVQAVTELDNKAAHCHTPVPQW
ncbi:hypothetical protein QJ152_13050, partial [Escherichia coli]|nr:hypothetical protein [Escherichia coli]MDK2531242.1 hypothetical protein [Escherichia coli]